MSNVVRDYVDYVEMCELLNTPAVSEKIFEEKWLYQNDIVDDPLYEHEQDTWNPHDIDTTSPDFEAGFEAGLRADDIQKSEEDSGEITPIEIDPDTLSEDERVFYDAGYDVASSKPVDMTEVEAVDAAYRDGCNEGFAMGKRRTNAF